MLYQQQQIKNIGRRASVAVLPLALGYTLLTAGSSFAASLAPPLYSATDSNGVNMATGQVSASLNDLSIGSGNFSLTHSISTHSSEFVNLATNYGYHEKFRGGLQKILIDKNNSTSPSSWTYVARAFDFDSTTDFLFNSNGTYTALKDSRDTMVYQSGVGFIVTKADGTEVTYPSAANGIDETGTGMSKIAYPNDFTVTIHKKPRAGSSNPETYSIGARVDSVTTNNGLQLKYFYNVRTRALDSSKSGATNDPQIPDNGLDWSNLMPDYIKAINNKVEYCEPLATTCALSQDWPTVTYTWPNGMPRAMYIGDSVFSVTDAMGRATEYHHKAIDKSLSINGTPVNGTPGAYFIPRLMKIKSANSTTPIVEYEYQNIFTPTGCEGTVGLCLNQWISVGEGTLISAKSNGKSWSYHVGAKGSQYSLNPDDYQHISSGYQAIGRYAMNNKYNVPVRLELWDKTVELASDYDNRVTLVTKHFGGGTIGSFKYDSRGNMTERWEDGTPEKASYPASCTNRKTCNKPTWISDGKANKTYYSYHSQSGQLATEASPSVNGDRVQTINTYSQKYASYKQGGSGLTLASTPVWMLSSQKSCIDSNYNGYGCTANDEVVPSYEYDTNLFLTGVAVTAEGKTLRTCYSNDIYGNRIGATQPKAGLTSCPL